MFICICETYREGYAVAQLKILQFVFFVVLPVVVFYIRAYVFIT
jgi:hypothetical protein